MAAKSSTVRLNNGYEMPLIGFGTANVSASMAEFHTPVSTFVR